MNRTTYLTEIDPSVLVSSDYDAVSIVWDHYGVPWDSFIAADPLPRWWEDRLNRTVDAALAWKLPIVLTLPGGGGLRRSCPADNASESGSTYPNIRPVDGCPSGACFDYNEVTNPIAAFFRQGYVNFALFMAAKFNPVNIVIALEANRVAEVCPQTYASYVDFVNQVYDTIKNFNAALTVYPSFSHESIMGVGDGQACEGQAQAGGAVAPPTVAACTKDGYRALDDFKRDVFAVTMAPERVLISLGGGASWPLWYATVVLNVLSARDAAAIAIMEYGYPSASLIVNSANDTVARSNTPSFDASGDVALSVSASHGGPAAIAKLGAAPTPICVPLLNATTTDATDFFNYIVDLSTRYAIGFVAFHSARSILPTDASSSCPCQASAPHQWACTYIGVYRNVCAQQGLPPYACEADGKVMSSLGVRDVDGAPLAGVYAALQSARQAGDVRTVSTKLRVPANV